MLSEVSAALRRRGASPGLSGPETLTKKYVFEQIGRQTLRLIRFGDRGACVLKRSVLENAVF